LHDWSGVFRRISAEVKSLLAARGLGAPPRVQISPGELLDKIGILQIKSVRITDPEKLQHVREELQWLEAVRDQSISGSDMLDALAAELKAVNERLWEIEDEVRGCERATDFGQRFIELARGVYRENDRRAELKRQINGLLGSRLVEEKVYQA
jgi:hypothetical protein